MSIQNLHQIVMYSSPFLIKVEGLDGYKEWNWGVKRKGKYINITEYLNYQDIWIKIISDTLRKISSFEENN